MGGGELSLKPRETRAGMSDDAEITWKGITSFTRSTVGKVSWEASLKGEPANRKSRPSFWVYLEKVGLKRRSDWGT